MKKPDFKILLLAGLLITVAAWPMCAHAQARKPAGTAKTASPAKTAAPAKSTTTAPAPTINDRESQLAREKTLQRAREDSARQVLELAREIARQIVREDSIKKAEQGALTPPPVAEASLVTVNRKTAMNSPKGIILLGAAVIFNDVNGATLPGGSVGLGYAVGRKLGILISADYTTGTLTAYTRSNGNRNPGFDFPTKSFLIQSEFRFYPKRALEGFYLGLAGGYLTYQTGTAYFSNQGEMVRNIEDHGAGHLGLTLGITITTPSRLSFELGISPSVVGGPYDSLYFSGSGRFRIGYAF